MFESKIIPSIVIIVLSYVGHSIYSVTNYDEFLAFISYLAISVIAYFMTNAMIPPISKLTEKADIFGYDINKKGIFRSNFNRNTWRIN